MSVLIKGMEMPPEGCTFLVIIHPDGTLTNLKGNELKATAIEVPSHGDLIDRDALAVHKFFCVEHDISNADGGACYRRGWDDAVDAIMVNAPAVIPASEEVYGQYTDTAGNFHWCGTHSGEHKIKAEEGET